MNTQEDSGDFRIGAVERLSGVPAVTIRMWERRYQAVTPERSPGGGRIYGRQQIERLTMLKQLVDSGHAISTVAGLSDDELRQRLEEPLMMDRGPRGPLAVYLVGQPLLDEWPVATAEAGRLQLMGSAADSDGALAKPAPPVDVLVVALDALPPGGPELLQRLVQHVQARCALLVYHFATRKDLARLQRWNIEAIKAPLAGAQMARLLPQLLGRRPVVHEAVSPVEVLALKAPPSRRYSQAELNVLARRSQSVKCECPEHLVELVNKLAAFEAYSRQCESANRGDAALHMMLHGVTAQVRRNMEDILAHVLEHELDEVGGTDGVAPSPT